MARGMPLFAEKSKTMKFTKYTSIENSFNEEYIGNIRMQIPADTEFVVQEKVHGANASFICDGDRLQIAKRTEIIGDSSCFFNCHSLVCRYRQHVVTLTEHLMRTYPEVKQVTVFGELFGGGYPHPDVMPDNSSRLVQKGIWYTPHNEFYAFDIYVSDGQNGRYLPVTEANTLFERFEFFYAKTLFTGTLEQCLAYPNEFRSNIPQWLGLPPIEGNICEGVVIRPTEPLYLRNGRRVIVKNKNERFSEKRHMKAMDSMTVSAEISEALQTLLHESAAYVNAQRLANVISHIGEVDIPKERGRLSGMLAKDALEDFLKEHGAAFAALEKTEQKTLKKHIAELAMKTVNSF